MNFSFGNAQGEFDRGVALHQAGRLQEAEQAYTRAAQLAPRHLGALHNLGIIAVKTGRPEMAVACFKQVLAIDPKNVNSLNSLGEAYYGLRQGEEALACFDKVIALEPENASAYNNRGIMLSMKGETTAAIASWERAIEICARRPNMRQALPHTHNNMGSAYLEQADVERATENHRRAVELLPESHVFHSNLLGDMNHSTHVTQEEIVAAHKRWWEVHAKGIVPLSLEHVVRDPEKKLRVGFVSPDFRQHSVTYFLMELFSNYDRERIEIGCYGNVREPDALTEWVASTVNGWRNIRGMSDVEAARLIQNDRVDVLIELAGHTAQNRMLVFAHRPAPVQAAYLGYPVTTGGAAIGWRLTDALADPPGMTEGHFTERLWRLPRCAWCFHALVDPPVDELGPAARGEAFTFGTFNHFTKVTPQMIVLWGRIMNAVPGSRMMLKSRALLDGATCERVKGMFAKEGIAGERLILSKLMPSTAEHLSKYNEVDLALDTFPYAGTTTTCEALWMNVPVVTLEGRTHMSRVGVSLLRAVGLEGLIASNDEEYVEKAVGLARDREALANMRNGLRERVRTSAVMDGAGFARAFEEAVRGMWRKFCAGSADG